MQETNNLYKKNHYLAIESDNQNNPLNTAAPISHKIKTSANSRLEKQEGEVKEFSKSIDATRVYIQKAKPTARHLFDKVIDQLKAENAGKGLITDRLRIQAGIQESIRIKSRSEEELKLDQSGQILVPSSNSSIHLQKITKSQNVVVKLGSTAYLPYPSLEHFPMYFEKKIFHNLQIIITIKQQEINLKHKERLDGILFDYESTSSRIEKITRDCISLLNKTPTDIKLLRTNLLRQIATIDNLLIFLSEQKIKVPELEEIKDRIDAFLHQLLCIENAKSSVQNILYKKEDVLDLLRFWANYSTDDLFQYIQNVKKFPNSYIPITTLESIFGSAPFKKKIYQLNQYISSTQFLSYFGKDKVPPKAFKQVNDIAQEAISRVLEDLSSGTFISQKRMQDVYSNILQSMTVSSAISDELYYVLDSCVEQMKKDDIDSIITDAAERLLLGIKERSQSLYDLLKKFKTDLVFAFNFLKSDPEEVSKIKNNPAFQQFNKWFNPVDRMDSYYKKDDMHSLLNFFRIIDPLIREIFVFKVEGSLFFQKQIFDNLMLTLLTDLKKYLNAKDDQTRKFYKDKLLTFLKLFPSDAELRVLTTTIENFFSNSLQGLTTYIFVDDIQQHLGSFIGAAELSTRLAAEKPYLQSFAFKTGIENTREMLASSLIASMGGLGKYILPKFGIPLRQVTVEGIKNPRGIACRWLTKTVDRETWERYSVTRMKQLQQGHFDRLSKNKISSTAQSLNIKADISRTFAETLPKLCTLPGQESLMYIGILDMLFGSTDSHSEQFLQDPNGYYYHIDFARFLVPGFCFSVKTDSNEVTVYAPLRSFAIDHPSALIPLPDHLVDIVLSLDPEQIEKEWIEKGLVEKQSYFVLHHNNRKEAKKLLEKISKKSPLDGASKDVLDGARQAQLDSFNVKIASLRNSKADKTALEEITGTKIADSDPALLEGLFNSKKQEFEEQMTDILLAEDLNTLVKINKNAVIEFLKKRAQQEKVFCYSKIHEQAVTEFKERLRTFKQYLIQKKGSSGNTPTLREATEVVYPYLKPFLVAVARCQGNAYENLAVERVRDKVVLRSLNSVFKMANSQKNLFTVEELSTMESTLNQLKRSSPSIKKYYRCN